MLAGLEYERMDNRIDKSRIDEIRSVAFPTLTGDQIKYLERYGEVRETKAGRSSLRRGIAPTTL